MYAIIEYFSRNHTFAYLATFMVILAGVSTVFTIKRDTFPSFDLGIMTVLTQYPGASAEDVELSITNKIEKELKTLTGIDYITSLSMDNISSITVTLDPNVRKPDKVKQKIRDAVGRVTDLPSQIPKSPLITEIEASVLPIIEVGVTGEIPYKELRRISTQLENDLDQVPGVAKIDRIGYRNREIVVEIDPNSINQYSIPLRDTINAIKLRNLRLTAGNIKSGLVETSLITQSEFEDPMEVSDVIIRSSPEGIITRIKDIAQINDTFEENTIIPHLNGKPTIVLSIRKSEDADNIRVCNRIKEKIVQINKTLPENVEILFANDESTTVKNSFSIVVWNGVIGFIFVILILRLFLDFTLSIWVAMSIPFTFMGAIFLLPFFGSFLDTITLTSMIIVLGIIVDDAIIVSDSVYSRWQNGESPEKAAIEGTYQVWRPVLTTISTTLCAFAPMFFVPGTMGLFQ
ncbi:TPA: efflux RND transporter permease subunit [Candidatus Poribacteria bacterium]|nr:efflux RND transporter permease subunit [Candidatus Poribacteria bacterium]HIB86723.1 efflux RND transporter permease subunit [Candidatus Poribacteria bacterium]HIB99545.1 efflux RND transporter permease subunit [Candidatus Poribacteria bacterium]HIN28130.1 efflux RND transporter permease subunit [Candidatus Poribacteria bacterium]HIO09052.1 efflux RND transporter permease subunit [Candidatus Poribacteria bacterium]